LPVPYVTTEYYIRSDNCQLLRSGLNQPVQDSPASSNLNQTPVNPTSSLTPPQATLTPSSLTQPRVTFTARPLPQNLPAGRYLHSYKQPTNNPPTPTITSPGPYLLCRDISRDVTHKWDRRRSADQTLDFQPQLSANLVLDLSPPTKNKATKKDGGHPHA
jgi:hypothetical protein